MELQNMAALEATVKKISHKIARNECHQLLRQNKLKELEALLKTANVWKN